MPYSSHLKQFCRNFFTDVKAACTDDAYLSLNAFNQLFAKAHGFANYETMLKSNCVPVDVEALKSVFTELRSKGIDLHLTPMQLRWPKDIIFTSTEITDLMNDQLRTVQSSVPHTHLLKNVVPLIQPNGDSTWHIATEFLAKSYSVINQEWFESVLGEQHVRIIKGRNEYLDTLRLHAEAGDTAAMCSLAIRNLQRREYSKAKKLLEEAVEAGSIDAHVELARIYLFGLGEDSDIQRARAHYEIAASKEHHIALNELAHMYGPYGSFETDLDLFYQYHKQAADAGNFDSIGNVGSMLYYGFGVEQDIELAKAYFEKGGEKSDSCSLVNTAYDFAMVEDDFEKARLVLERAVTLGDTEAKCDLGIILLYGFGIKPDIDRALLLLVDAAEKDVPEAMFHIALCYSDGVGFEKSHEKSVFFLERASELGHGAAMNKLAVCYFNGYGVKSDIEQANNLFEESGKLGCSRGYFNLSQSYRFGHGLTVDLKQAFYYMHLSAEGGCSDAMSFLSSFYENGIGTMVNLTKSQFWDERAESTPSYIPYQYVDPAIRSYVPDSYFSSGLEV